MIVITGAAGFIGSYLTAFLNNKGIDKLVISDDFSVESKRPNWENKQFIQKIDRNELAEWIESNQDKIEFIFHLGARTDTAEQSVEVFDRLNLEYSKTIWKLAAQYGIPLIYASSAATYGSGTNGYDDDHLTIPTLKPLNPYGESKQQFDKWALRQSKQPPCWAGLKFFNVYGPNEYHKGRMASVVFHAFHQIRETGKLKLFRSHRPDFKDGEQKRDFIYVKDVAALCWFLYRNKVKNGIYNAGTGTARTFLDLALALFAALNQKVEIEFIDTPEDIRDAYQYFTEAKMDKIQSAGFNHEMMSLEEGVEDYVKAFLIEGKYY